MKNILLNAFGSFTIAGILTGCPGPSNESFYESRTLGINADRAFANDCSMGVYVTHCWTLTIRNQQITLSGTITNPIVGLPRNGALGTVTGIDIQGRYQGDIKPRISALLIAGTPPPICATAPPVDGPNIATTVVRFRITGDVEWNWGQGYTSNGIQQSNAVITKSNLALNQFDVQNLWSVADNQLRSALRNTVLRNADSEIVKRMNEIFALGSTVQLGLPVYAPGYNPYSSGGFCYLRHSTSWATDRGRQHG
jgi:hypothetical protein